MDRIRLRFSLMIFCMSIFVWESFAQSRTGDAADASVQGTAMAGLQAYLEKIPAGRERDYGFIDRDEFRRASVGTPIQVFTINPDSMQERIDPGRNYMLPLNEWRVPVVVNGEFRSLLTVSMVDKTLKIFELGGELMAKELVESFVSDPKSRKALLRLYHFQCDFLVLDRDGSGIENGEFRPLRSARLFFRDLSCSPAHPCFKADMYPRIQLKFAERQERER